MLTYKDYLFLLKWFAGMLGTHMLILFSYYGSQPQYLWDEAILMAADKTFWLGLVLAILSFGMLKFFQRKHTERK